MTPALMTPTETADARAGWRRECAEGHVFRRVVSGHWLQLVAPVAPGEPPVHFRLFTLRPHLREREGEVWAWTDALVDRAYDIGVRLWGERWRVHADAAAVDVAVQIAVFGEVRYG